MSSQTEEEVFDFIIWSGLPSDFPKISRAPVIRCDDHKDILSSSFHKLSAGSVVCTNDLGRAGTTEVYVQNVLGNDTFKHLVHIATDVQAEYNVRKRIYFLRHIFTTCAFLSFLRKLPLRTLWPRTTRSTVCQPAAC